MSRASRRSPAARFSNLHPVGLSLIASGASRFHSVVICESVSFLRAIVVSPCVRGDYHRASLNPSLSELRLATGRQGESDLDNLFAQQHHRCMRNPPRICVWVFVFSVLASVAAAEDDATCQAWQKSAAKVNAEVPVWTDFMTRSDGVAVLCSLKTIAFKHFLNASPADLRDGWQRRKQAQWNAIYCADARIRQSIADGWQITDLMTFANGEQFRLVADCSN